MVILLIAANGIDEEVFYELDDGMIAILIPELGFRHKFKKRLQLLLKEKKQNPLSPIDRDFKVDLQSSKIV